MATTRRCFLAASGGTAATLWLELSARAQTECQAKIPFVITVQASGAWDPTFLVDPVAGDAGFTPFSAAQILTAGAIRYAPSVTNMGVGGPYLVGNPGQDFFAKHAQRLLVFNGVDNATVSHDVGPRVAFSGSTRDGLPTLSGLVAGLQGRTLPLAMFVSGGFASTGGLVPITRGGSLSLLRGLASPNRDGIHVDEVDALLRRATRDRDSRLGAQSSIPRTRLAFEKIAEARSGALEERFIQIADELQRAGEGRRGSLAEAASGALALMRAGACAAAHISTGGFDTHDNHDQRHPGAVGRLLEGLDAIVETAGTDPVLSARGLVVVVGSDFGRTRYNDGGGKDHWPITSMMAMGIGAAESMIPGGRVIGATVPNGRNGVAALRLKIVQGAARVTEPGDRDGFVLTPAHVQLALRHAIGLCETGAPDDPLRRFRLTLQPQEPIPLRA